ncbi:MAG: ATP-dependent metallopeptidase FtsH/Yme1/Tma family protein [Lachnospiraceae bacterium]|nr:ATP-dependent metallopeptidase FtsH/Yme1/Tma family protein [Lachnospiraceae bacterium]
MKNCRNKKIKILAVVLVLAGALTAFYFTGRNTAEEVSYSSFYDAVLTGQVSEASIAEDKVYFKKQGDASDYVTDNPGTQDFKEFLLLHDVAVTQSYGASDIIYLIMDLLIDLIFIGLFVGIFVVVYRFTRKQFPVVKNVDCHFSDVAGMEEVKEELSQLVELLKHPAEFQKRGIRQPNGILLVGPPGNGKTLLARALAGETDVNFIAAKATDFQSMYMSIGPAKIKALFRRARKCAPCIVFIDEFDGLGERRNYAGQAIDKENNRMVTALLNELDGFAGHSRGVLVVAATNNAQDLDSALIRPGRFDRKYVIKNPDRNTREELIRLYLKETPLAGDIDVASLAKSFDGMSCAWIEAAVNEALLSARARQSEEVAEEDFETGIKRLRGKG